MAEPVPASDLAGCSGIPDWQLVCDTEQDALGHQPTEDQPGGEEDDEVMPGFEFLEGGGFSITAEGARPYQGAHSEGAVPQPGASDGTLGLGLILPLFPTPPR